ncbi:hypothetical protein LCGC14_2256220, partial [marine sediment metagenome]
MKTQNVFRMYFGRNIGEKGNRVCHLDMRDFIQAHIVPVFPGFTIYDGIGYWEGEQEDCFIVEIIASFADDPNSYEGINKICN